MRASTKKGNQHIVNALMMIPKVVLAFRSFASWNLNFFWLGLMLGDGLDEVSSDALACLRVGLDTFVLFFPDSMGHCDSLLCLELKHLPSVVLSRLHCNKRKKPN